MASSPEELRTIQHLAETLQHCGGSAKPTSYDSDVLPVQNFSRAYLFSRALTAGANLNLTLPAVGSHSSLQLLQWNGDASDTLTLTPKASDRVNGGGLGVAKVYTSLGSSTKFIIFAVHNHWHVYHIGSDPITLTAGAGISITGTYPNLTITNLNP